MKIFLPVLLLAAGILSSSLLQAQKIIRGAKECTQRLLTLNLHPRPLKKGR
jgi:hypothetical protein